MRDNTGGLSVQNRVRRLNLYLVILSLALAPALCNYLEDLIGSSMLDCYRCFVETPRMTTFDVSGIPLDSKWEIEYDENGVPLINYGSELGLQRNPVYVSAQALSYHNEYLKGNLTCKKLFLNCANWLVNNSIEYDNYSLWEYNFYWEPYNMKPPWRSGMAQGLGVQVLANAYNVTGDEKYLYTAQSALNSFNVTTKEGGVTQKDGSMWWYEEYVDNNSSNIMVLNGMMYTLIGIYEYYNITRDENAKILYNNGLASLIYNLPEYDMYGWSYYSSYKEPSKKNYHMVHIIQLDRIYHYSKNPIFKEYYKKWDNYKIRPYLFVIRFLYQPNKMALAIYILNSVMIFLVLYIMTKIGRLR